VTYVIAEIGINHNGDLDTAVKLINAAWESGCDAVKFQKRTVETVYTQEELEKPRPSTFGNTNGDLKRGLELSQDDYNAINKHCRNLGIDWSASCWDEDSVDFIEQYNPPWYKIASASLTDDGLLQHTSNKGKPIFLSTGMSTIGQIDHAVSILGKCTLMHTVSTYPADDEDLNLLVIQTLQRRYGLQVGYSGHESGTLASVVAVALGATVIERHLTLDRKMWGSDQAASLEPAEMRKLVDDIRMIEKALGHGDKILLDKEVPIMQKLRRK